MSKQAFFKLLPKVDELLLHEDIASLVGVYPRQTVVDSIRYVLEDYRNRILSLGEDDDFSLDRDEIVVDIVKLVEERSALSIKKVINGTGTVLHTNLGRSLITESIRDRLFDLTSRFSNLEYNISQGCRGSRYDHVTETIKTITGCEDVLIVNNNAAAVMLVLSTLGKGGETIVSRGELVEVGGSFRIPDIMALSGSHLVEVGSTNKTHIFDYENAITENTKLLMKVHTSNYKIEGFTESIPNREMKALGEKYNLPVIEDLGSGVLVDLSKYGLPYEPTVMDSIKSGIDVVTFSGDKLLGGPQAGIIIGKKEYIQRMKRNQLLRALRVDKITLSILEMTCRLYLDEEKALQEIPTLRMITMPLDLIHQRAIKLLDMIKYHSPNLEVSIEKDLSQVGGGSLPGEYMDTMALAISPHTISVSSLESRLRLSPSHIIGRVKDNRYILDVRTIFDDEFPVIAMEIANALKEDAL